jgi:hypothetical protein
MPPGPARFSSEPPSHAFVAGFSPVSTEAAVRPTTHEDGPIVVELQDPAATAPWLVGAKAANLARAATAGLPVLPGLVVTTLAPSADRADPRLLASLHEHWLALSDQGERSLVVRSSSTVEDTEVSSMAGRFLSVVDVLRWPQFLEAVGDVQRSASRAQRADRASRPMAVLVQPMLRCRERVPEEIALVSVAELDDHRVVLLLEPSLTDHAWHRLDGCLEDMTLEQVTARADRLVAPELGAVAP